MPLLLHIDTAGEKAFVAISKANTLLAHAKNEVSNTHAEFVQTAIDRLLKETSLKISEIDAVVVTMGPGSYTGLRVGLASAKGIAYAIDKPLIGLSTLALLQHKAVKEIPNAETNYKIFSMIDARRMEVFGALYDNQGIAIFPEQAIILDTAYIESLLYENILLYCVGSGANKVKMITNHPNIHFIEEQYTLQDCIELASIKFAKKQFENLAYSSPSYIKDFYMAKPNTN